jgi:hypothetical protein
MEMFGESGGGAMDTTCGRGGGVDVLFLAEPFWI